MPPVSGTTRMGATRDEINPVQRKSETRRALHNDSATPPKKRGIMTADLVPTGIEEEALDPTVPTPMTNVAEYGFEGRFEDWAEDALYFEYSKAANPIGSGHTSKI